MMQVIRVWVVKVLLAVGASAVIFGSIRSRRSKRTTR